jgi:hypothetical protein
MNIKHTFHKVLHGAGQVGKGIADAGAEEARGVVHVAKHPGRTAKGVSRLVTHPKSTLAALGDDAPGKPDTRSSARKAGEVGGHLAIDVLSLGTAPALRAARSADRVGQAGAARYKTHGVKAGDVFKGAGSTVAEPAKETWDAVSHPGRTVRGAGQAVKHPRRAAEAVGKAPAPVERTDGQKVGRGLARLVGMGPLPDGVRTVKHGLKTGSKVDRATR